MTSGSQTQAYMEKKYTISSIFTMFHPQELIISFINQHKDHKDHKGNNLQLWAADTIFRQLFWRSGLVVLAADRRNAVPMGFRSRPRGNPTAAKCQVVSLGSGVAIVTDSHWEAGTHSLTHRALHL